MSSRYFFKKGENGSYIQYSYSTVVSLIQQYAPTHVLNFGASSCGQCPDPEPAKTHHTEVVWKANRYNCCTGTMYQRRFECSTRDYATSLWNYVQGSYEITNDTYGTRTVSGYSLNSCGHNPDMSPEAYWTVQKVEWDT